MLRAKNYIHTNEGEDSGDGIKSNDEETTEDVAHLLSEIADIASKEVPFAVCCAPRKALKIRAVTMTSPELKSIASSETPIENDCILGPESLPSSPHISPHRDLLDSFRPRGRPGATIEERTYNNQGLQHPIPNLCSCRSIRPATAQESNGVAIGCVSRSSKAVPTKKVLHKKFCWKNYPELEEFLVANRDEYLRHSTLNYTSQQKQYNNKLTERMLELASECGYAFDEHDFSFVAVRDRIRCYYKSYVQSLKKRGVVIGYAARKAGLVTDHDLEQSACKKATIYVPNTMKH